MASPRDGTVQLTLADGRTVPIRFTWRAIDKLGAGGVGELLERAQSGLPGDLKALAMLIHVASDEAVTVDELMDGNAPPYMVTYLAVLSAWTQAARPLSGEDGAASRNPLKRLRTSLRGLWRRLSRQG